LDSIEQRALLRNNTVDIKRIADQRPEDVLRKFERVLTILNEERASLWELRIWDQLLCQPVGRNAAKAFVSMSWIRIVYVLDKRDSFSEFVDEHFWTNWHCGLPRD
jgi:hypothetical protein